MKTFRVNGECLVPQICGALYWPAAATLIVADLHLEKGSAFAAKGQFLPPYDSLSTLGRLADAAARLCPRRVIALGDSFHDGEAVSRMAPKTAAFLLELTASFPWVWIVGNHDPEPPACFGGEVLPELEAGPFLFRHAPRPGHVPGEVAGHLHPCASVSVKGRGLRRRCFATDGYRVVLPAFGAYAGGLDVLDVAFAGVLRPDFHAWMIGRREVYPIASRRLVSRAA